MWLSNQGKYMSVQLPSADLDPRTEWLDQSELELGGP